MTDLLINNWPIEENLEKKPMRFGFGEAILALARKHKEIVVLCADLISSLGLTEFQKVYPKRFFQTGVAEQNMIGLAAGLAITGKIPFTASFGTFCPGRCLDQIRIQVCLNKLNIKIVASHVGLSHQADGATVQATEDIAIMRSLPGMSVVFPADYNQMLEVVKAIFYYNGPVYLRMTREPTPVFINKKASFKFGKAQILKAGNDITIVSAGPLLYEVLLAANAAAKENISCEVINLHTIKPIDKKTLINSVKKTSRLLTVEDHQIQGGLGSAVIEAIASNCPVPTEMIGLKNMFGSTARKYKQLLEKYGLTKPYIFKKIKDSLSA